LCKDIIYISWCLSIISIIEKLQNPTFLLYYLETFKLSDGFKPLRWIFKFKHKIKNLAPTSSWLCICRCLGLLQYQVPSYSSPHVTPQHALDLKKKKCLVAKTEIGRFCTNLNVIPLNCYILCSALQRLQLSLTTSKKNLKMWGQLLSNTYNKTHHTHHCLFSNTSKKA